MSGSSERYKSMKGGVMPRWNTFEPGNELEENERNDIVARIESWWREFENRTQDLDGMFSKKMQWDIAIMT